MFRERIEALALERRHEPTRHAQGAEDRIVEANGEDAAKLEIEKGKIERRIVRNHDRIAEELAKGRQHLLDAWGLAHHVIADGGKPGYKARNSSMWPH